MESPDTDTVPLALCSVHTFSPAAEFHCSDADQESESVVVAVGEGGGGRLWAFGEVAVTFHVPLYEALQPGQGPPAVAIPTPDDSIRTVASAPARANADFRAARSTLLFGVVEVESAAAPPGDGGVGEVGCAEDG